MVTLIAEIGSNWLTPDPEDRLACALEMIDRAVEGGADCVKFQLFRAHTTYAVGSGSCPHLAEKGIDRPIGELFRDLELPIEWLPELARAAEKRGVGFILSTFSEEDFRVADPYVTHHKIASPELHDPTLLQLAAASGKPLFLSTGMATEEEIDWALSYFSPETPLTLMQCTVQYPTDPTAMHLSLLPKLAERFQRPIGLSDHSSDPCVAPVMAVAYGAVAIEKHVTLDRKRVGPDQSWAISLEEWATLCQAVRLAEKMRGEEKKKEVLQEELPLRRFSRRSIQTIRKISAGERFSLGFNLAILRPGTRSQGVHPRYLREIEGKAALRAIPCGEGIQEGDWE